MATTSLHQQSAVSLRASQLKSISRSYPGEPGIGNVFESANNCAAFSGSFSGHARGA